jgi:hypothetical protein
MGSPGDGICRDQNFFTQPNGSQRTNCARLRRAITRLNLLVRTTAELHALCSSITGGNENELFHRVFLSRSGDPNALIPAKSSDSSVCVWDLRLQSFEREAWIRHILCKAITPDFQAYLDERLNDDG